VLPLRQLLKRKKKLLTNQPIRNKRNAVFSARAMAIVTVMVAIVMAVTV
jgi:hypothetical protein